MIRIRGRTVNQRLGTGPGARLAGVLVAAILISGLASACRPGQGDEARPLTSIESAQDLRTALEGSGIPVEDGGIFPAGPGEDVGGQIFLANSEAIYVLEGQAAWEPSAVRELLASGLWTDLGQQAERPGSVWRHGRLIVAYPGDDGGIILALWALLGDPMIPIPGGVREPYPPAVLAVLDEASALFGVPPADLVVAEMKESVWQDACLGLPEPAEICASAEVSGWLVEVQDGNQRARFRTDATGEAIRLEKLEND
jgi:hypothetical protein